MSGGPWSLSCPKVLPLVSKWGKGLPDALVSSSCCCFLVPLAGLLTSGWAGQVGLGEGDLLLAGRGLFRRSVAAPELCAWMCASKSPTFWVTCTFCSSRWRIRAEPGEGERLGGLACSPCPKRCAQLGLLSRRGLPRAPAGSSAASGCSAEGKRKAAPGAEAAALLLLLLLGLLLLLLLEPTLRLGSGQ